VQLSGGELRIDVPSSHVHAAVVTEGVPLGTEDVIPAYVLQHALGGAPFVQYSLNASSRLNKAAASVTNEPFAVSNFTVLLIVIFETLMKARLF
jgi:hypothetical protein